MEASTTLGNRPGSRYGLAEIQRGLTAVAYANGNTYKAARDLKAEGIKIGQKTLWRWFKADYPDEYDRIRREVLPVVGAEVADEHMDAARRSIKLANDLMDRASREVDSIPARDLPGAFRNASTSAGIHTDKARLLAGDFETPPKATKDLASVLRQLKAKGLGLTLEDDEQVVDAEVVED